MQRTNLRDTPPCLCQDSGEFANAEPVTTLAFGRFVNSGRALPCINERVPISWKPVPHLFGLSQMLHSQSDRAFKLLIA